jgi:Uma2 family endonuclease
VSSENIEGLIPRPLAAGFFIRSPKVPTVSVYVLVDGVYQLRQFRDGDGDSGCVTALEELVIASATFPELRLTAAEILTVVE